MWMFGRREIRGMLQEILDRQAALQSEIAALAERLAALEAVSTARSRPGREPPEDRTRED
jgi:hypothetical protein